MPHPKNIEELLPFLNTCLYYKFNQKKIYQWNVYTYKWYYQILFCTESIEDINWNSEDQKYSNILSENLTRTLMLPLPPAENSKIERYLVNFTTDLSDTLAEVKQVSLLLAHLYTYTSFI